MSSLKQEEFLEALKKVEDNEKRKRAQKEIIEKYQSREEMKFLKNSDHNYSRLIITNFSSRTKELTGLYGSRCWGKQEHKTSIKLFQNEQNRN